MGAIKLPHFPRTAARIAACMALSAAGAVLALPAAAQAASRCAAAAWPLWDTFQQRHVSADGRVIDTSTPQQYTTSEGQSYAMFFALVADDAAGFERLWQWTAANLAGGDPPGRLPAWQWGARGDGSWGVTDDNSAADSDLWIAYDLLEAGRIWARPEYTRTATAMLKRIAADEVADLPGLGKMLLPGPAGFALENHVWRLNPSYLPLPLLRRLAGHDPQGPWREIAANTARMLQAVTPHGFVADWVAYQAPKGGVPTFAADPVKGTSGSYDAIRAYMWAGMTPAADPSAAAALRALSGMAGAVSAQDPPPEFVDAATGAVRGTGPVGFSAALLPYLAAYRQTEALAAQRARVRGGLPAAPAQTANAPPYYDYVLGLFGTGWDDKRYGFLPSGALTTSWEKACRHAATR